MGEAVGAYPELDQICNALLPEELQREDASIADESEASPGTSSVSRRASTKRTGRELHAQNRNGVAKTRRTKRELVAEKTADNRQSSPQGIVNVPDGNGQLYMARYYG